MGATTFGLAVVCGLMLAASAYAFARELSRPRVIRKRVGWKGRADLGHDPRRPRVRPMTRKPGTPKRKQTKGGSRVG